MDNTASANGAKDAPREQRSSQRAWLALARTLWALLSLGGIGVFVIGTAGLFYGLTQPCTSLPIEGQGYCLVRQQSLLQLGISPDLYAVYLTVGVIVEILP